MVAGLEPAADLGRGVDVVELDPSALGDVG